ncbi:hypothetical protein [Winogradskyella poriferorum]|uniref:hypothetical protein n=1 Tax=Winogradskyella poriferorum TaxID=307627 RepID=UPI003D654EB3
MSLLEAIDKFFYMRDIMLEVIDKNLLDNLPYAYRNTILNSLNNLFANRKNATNSLTYLETIGNQFYSYKIEDLLGRIDFKTDLQEAVKARQEYRKISNALRKGLKWVQEIEQKHKNLTELEDQSIESSEKIETSRKLINEAKDRILEAQKDIDSKKIVVDNTFESAEETRKILKDAEKKADTIESKYQKGFNSFSDNIRNKNTELQKENASIQKEVNKLLQGAVAGKLHEGFITRKKELEKTLNVWLFGIILLNIAILLFSFSLIYGVNNLKFGPIIPNNGYYPEIKSFFYVFVLGSFLFFIVKKYLFSQTKYVLRIPQLLTVLIISIFVVFLFFEGIAIPDINKIDFGQGNIWSPIIKLLITIPLIILDWFLIKEYSYRKDFVEKYTFKSAISLSLLTYRDLIKQEKNVEAVKFINNAIEKIYKDPFEEDKYSLAKKEKELLTSVVDSLSKKMTD